MSRAWLVAGELVFDTAWHRIRDTAMRGTRMGTKLEFIVGAMPDASEKRAGARWRKIVGSEPFTLTLKDP